MSQGVSFSWGPLGGSASQRVTVKPEEKKMVIGCREGLLAFVDVTKPNASDANASVTCKTCKTDFAAKKERLAAHFTLQKKLVVPICKEPPAGAAALGTAVLAEIAEKRRDNNKKRNKKTEKTKNVAMEGTQTNLRRTWNKQGRLDTDKARVRLPFATGQSFVVDHEDMASHHADQVLDFGPASEEAASTAFPPFPPCPSEISYLFPDDTWADLTFACRQQIVTQHRRHVSATSPAATFPPPTAPRLETLAGSRRAQCESRKCAGRDARKIAGGRGKGAEAPFLGRGERVRAPETSRGKRVRTACRCADCAKAGGVVICWDCHVDYTKHRSAFEYAASPKKDGRPRVRSVLLFEADEYARKHKGLKRAKKAP